MIGIDEVGRGCWAGPLVVVAARQKLGLPEGIKDSKLLTSKKRQTLFPDIVNSCDIGEGWVSHQEIDQFGLANAMRLGAERALAALNAQEGESIIFDGTVNYCHTKFTNVQTLAKADNLYPIVSAASIVAKVRRDNYMAEASKQYPNYQFEKHVGYGTKLHVAALKEFGVSPLHRVSFRPIRALL